MPQSSSMQQRFFVWLSDNPGESILRWIFRVVVTVTIAALAVDLAGMNGWGWGARPDPAATPAEIRDLPSIMPSILPPPPPDGPMAKPMTFELVSGGKLMATGTIAPGISEAFAAEVSRHGEYIKTVVLSSPGGSVADALTMGRLIREKKFATEVEAGKFCASSCPLVFAAGVERRAGDRAAIGVHQVAAISSAANGPPRNEMNVAQNISARCQRYLADMGLNLQVWVHAMETPHDKLFVFKPDELKSLNMVTAAPASAPTAAPVTTSAGTKTRL